MYITVEVFTLEGKEAAILTKPRIEVPRGGDRKWGGALGAADILSFELSGICTAFLLLSFFETTICFQ